MAVEAPERQATSTSPYPYSLLRANFPYLTTLGMRRFTTACIDLALGDEGRLYVLCREDATGGTIRRLNWDDEDLGTIGGGGSGDGQFQWPVQILRDRAETLYVSDEGLHRISSFNRDGTFLGKWGEHGTKPGQLNRPSGLAFDADENMFVVDTQNHRVQKFTKDGEFISTFGSYGSGPGQFDMPWGIAVDLLGDLFVVDWRNDRVQKFTADGEFVMEFGRSGSGDGELHRPAGVTVDLHGDIYVADRGNHRVLLFDRTGRYVEKFIGDSGLSKCARTYILANPKVLRGREMTTLEDTRRFRGPTSVRVDELGRLYVTDFGSHRVQVYQKEAYPLTEADILPEQDHPFLYNV